MSETQIPPQFEEAEHVQAEARAGIERIRNDRTLVPQAQQAQMARVILNANARIAELRAQYAGGREQQRRRLERQAFGIPEGVHAAASYRDGLDRVDRLQDTPNGATAEQQAMALTDRATRSGDQLMLQALATVAVERGWRAVIERVAAELPQTGDALRGLLALKQRANDRMLASMYLDDVTAPVELNGCGDLETVAAWTPPPSTPGRNQVFDDWLKHPSHRW
jgi:hypothetical protein